MDNFFVWDPGWWRGKKLQVPGGWMWVSSIVTVWAYVNTPCTVGTDVLVWKSDVCCLCVIVVGSPESRQNDCLLKHNKSRNTLIWTLITMRIGGEKCRSNGHQLFFKLYANSKDPVCNVSTTWHSPHSYYGLCKVWCLQRVESMSKDDNSVSNIYNICRSISTACMIKAYIMIYRNTHATEGMHKVHAHAPPP